MTSGAQADLSARNGGGPDAAPQSSEVFVVDDDASVRAALAVVFAGEGYQVTGFGEGETFLSAALLRTPWCILLDVHMPGRSGIDLLKELNAKSYPAPVFIISGQGDIPMAVEAIRNGALDFIEKPFDAVDVVMRVREAVRARAQRAIADAVRPREFPGCDLLTPRECEVLDQIAQGASNKEAGRRLSISPRTIEVHRARIMEKLGARNAADLMRIVLNAGRGH
jgi:FixJ family two-component response regulator